MLTWFFKWCGVFFVTLVLAVNIGKSTLVGLDALWLLVLPIYLGIAVGILAVVDGVVRIIRWRCKNNAE